MATTIDEMLDLFSFASWELVNGNANHGPMASETLFALGRDEAVLPWVEGYRFRLTHRPPLRCPFHPMNGRTHWAGGTVWAIGWSFLTTNWSWRLGGRLSGNGSPA